MSSAQDRLVWPGTRSSSSLYIQLYYRQTEGSGAYASLGSAGSAPNLTMVAPTGVDAGVIHSALAESIIQYLENDSWLVHWYCPKTGTLRSNLLAALNAKTHLGTGTSLALNLFFDGQFGPVLAA